MAWFNVLVGLLVGGLVMVPLFFVTRNMAKGGIAIAALGSVFIASVVSQQYLYPQYLLWRFEQALQAQPVFVLIQKNHPEAYRAYLEKIRENFRKNQDIGMVTSDTADLVNQIFQQHLAKAPNAPIELFLRSTVELYRYLYTKMPEAIVVMETGRNATSVNLQSLEEDATFRVLLDRLLDTKKLIIQEAMQSPVHQTDATKAKDALNKIYEDLAKKFGAEIMQSVFSPTSVVVPPRISSIVILDFYNEILSTGKETTGDMMRYIASQHSTKTK